MEITVQEFAKLKGDLFVLDIREAWELKKARIQGVTHCPMDDLVSSVEALPTEQPIYVLCHHGVRSLKVAIYLQSQGLEAFSIKGGIDAYARDIDPSVGFY